jgi:hypothetical protein
MGKLIPQIVFVKGHAMALQEGPIFFLKRFLVVMLLLGGDVLTHGGDIGLGNGEGPVSRLPGEAGKFGALGFDPFGRNLFDLFHGVADRDSATQFKEDVDVIRDRVDEDGRASQVLQDGRHVTVQGVAHGVMQDGFAVFGGEDEMDVQPGEGLWHGLKRPFRASTLLWADFPKVSRRQSGRGGGGNGGAPDGVTANLGRPKVGGGNGDTSDAGAEFLGRPFRAPIFGGVGYPGRCPGLKLSRAFGAKRCEASDGEAPKGASQA